MTAEEVRSVVFQKAAVGGYKQSDVDLFLDEVAVCIESMTAKIRALEKAKFEAGKSAQQSEQEPVKVAVSVPEVKKEEKSDRPKAFDGISDYGIQNLLLKAQKLAEQIEAEARQASEELLAKSAEDAQDIISRADSQAEETIEKANAILADAQRKEASINAAARAEAENIINEAVARSGQMLTTTREKLKEEQELCRKLRTDFNQVRGIIVSFYEEQLKELNSQTISQIAETDFPDVESEVESVPQTEDSESEESVVSYETQTEDISSSSKEVENPEIKLSFSAQDGE